MVALVEFLLWKSVVGTKGEAIDGERVDFHNVADCRQWARGRHSKFKAHKSETVELREQRNERLKRSAVGGNGLGRN